MFEFGTPPFSTKRISSFLRLRQWLGLHRARACRHQLSLRQQSAMNPNLLRARDQDNRPNRSTSCGSSFQLHGWIVRRHAEIGHRRHIQLNGRCEQRLFGAGLGLSREGRRRGQHQVVLRIIVVNLIAYVSALVTLAHDDDAGLIEYRSVCGQGSICTHEAHSIELRQGVALMLCELFQPRRPPKVPHLWPPKLLHPAGGDLMH